MTEDEAKTKWCPFARAAFGWNEREVLGGNVVESGIVGASVNRGRGASDPCLCLGTGCMMWRPDKSGRDRYFVSVQGEAEEEWQWDPTDNDTYKNRVTVRTVSAEKFGHCGMSRD